MQGAACFYAFTSRREGYIGTLSEIHGCNSCADLIFADGFESVDSSEWDFVSNGENLAITSAAACPVMFGRMRITVFDCWEILGELKEIIPTAPIQIDRQLRLDDLVSDLILLFKAEHREKLFDRY